MTSLLMIEDDERLAGMVADYLSASGYAVDHAPDGHCGLARLEQAPPELVILDLMLPDMDGLQVCRQRTGACAHAHSQGRSDGPHHRSGNGGGRLPSQAV